MSPAAPAAIHLVAGEHVTCTFTNRYVPPPGGVTIRKITEGDVGTFAYTVRPTSGGGSSERVSATTTEEGVPVNAEPSLQSLAPGAYEIEEGLPSSPQGSWRLTSVHCSDSSRARSEPVTVTIRSSAPVACVFTNTFIPRGSIAITKVTQGGVGGTGFEITPLQGTPATYLQSATTTRPGVAAAAHPHTSQDATDHLELGSYRIVEEPPASGPAGHWTLTGVRCNRVDVPFAEGGLVVTLTRHAPAVHCEFTNELQRHPPPEPPAPRPPKPDPDEPSDPYGDLSVVKRPAAPSIAEGGLISYRIIVTNHGPDAADRVIVRDQSTGRGTIVSVQTTAGRCLVRGDVVCELGTLGAHHHDGDHPHVRAGSATGSLSDRAVVGTASLDPNLGNDIATARVQVLGPPAPARSVRQRPGRRGPERRIAC